MDLLLSAAKFEIEPFIQFLKSFGHHIPDIASVGVGVIDAAASSKELTDRAKGKDVVFVGTCGVFGTFDQPAAYRVNQVLWLPCSDRLGFSYSISGLYPKIELLEKSTGALSHLPAAAALCGPSISLVGDENGFVKDLLPPGYLGLENIELYPVAKTVLEVCRSFDVLLVTTNTIGSSAHSEWKRSFQDAAVLTQKILHQSFIVNKGS